MSSSVNFPSNLLFENYFGARYQERWPELRAALQTPEKQVLRKNRFVDSNDEGLVACDFLDQCYWKPEPYTLKKNSEGFYNYYIMDPASVLVARALGVDPNDQVLDLCAAPGGKSLILTEALGPEGRLIANEVSEGRRERLMRVLHEYVPKERRMQVTVKGLDGNQFGLRWPSSFDKVLADVPCSGERHLLENPSEFSLWTAKRTSNLAVRQYSLLSAAWLAAKEGGRIVYSTCSISPAENDSVVAKLIKKRSPQLIRLPDLEKLDFVEPTEQGYQILPDRCGFGPMYFSVLTK